MTWGLAGMTWGLGLKENAPVFPRGRFLFVPLGR